MKGARKLVAVYAAQLAVAEGELLIGVGLEGVDQNTAGAVHGLDREILLVDEGGVHIFLVVIPVTRGLPQGTAHDLRGLDLQIFPLAVNLAPVVDEGGTEGHTVGKEEGHTGSLVAEGEETHILAQLSVVTALCFLDAGEVFLKLGLVGECGAVDTGEHLVLLAASPVRACHRGELERLDRGGIGDVRACAEVYEVALLKEGKLLVLGKIVDELYLVGLAALFHQSDCLGAGEGEALQLQIFLGDLLHFGFQSGELLLGEGVVAVEVIVEAVLDRGTDGKLRVGIEALDCLCENVRCGVAQGVSADLVLKGAFGNATVVHNNFHVFPPWLRLGAFMMIKLNTGFGG